MIFAKNATSRLEHKARNNKKKMEENKMAEKKPVVTDEEEVEEVTERKPAKKPVKKTEEKEKKPNIFVRFWHGVKRHKKEIFAGAGGVIVGSTATWGAGKIGEHIASKRAQNNYNDNNE